MVQASPKVVVGAIPANQNAATPTVDAIAQETVATAANQYTSFSRSKDFLPSVRRLNNSHATICSKVLPAVITQAATTPEPLKGSVDRFVSRAPAAMPGHNRRPNTSNTGRATPEEGEKGETIVSGNWNSSPTRATA